MANWQRSPSASMISTQTGHPPHPPHRLLRGRTKWSRRLAIILCAAFGSPPFFASEAVAEPTVYVNPTASSIDSGDAYEIPGNAASINLHIYVDAGSLDATEGTPCIDGNGEHLCAVEVELEALGNLSFGFYSIAPGVDWHFDGANRLNLILAQGATPTRGPRSLGSIRVTSGIEPGSLRLTGGGVVVGQLSFQEWETEDIAYVPEPGFGLGLFLATGLLASLGAFTSKSANGA